jgi:hypothetical protein
MNELEDEIGSIFLERYDDYEPIFLFGRTKRQLILSGGCFFSIVLGALLYWLQFPDFFVWMVIGVIAGPTFIYGTRKEIEIKERLRFRLTNQERAYLVSEERGKKYDFTQEKSVREAFSTSESSSTTAEKGI